MKKLHALLFATMMMSISLTGCIGDEDDELSVIGNYTADTIGTATANNDDGSCMYDVTLTVDLNCAGFTPGYVSATGPADNWSCGAYSLTDNNLDGIWEGTFSLPAGLFEYIYCADGWAQSEAQELVTNGTNSGDWSCTPITDYWSFANRSITVGSLNTSDTWGTCSSCIVPIITSHNINELL